MSLAWVVAGTLLGVILAILVREWVSIYIIWEKYRTLKGTKFVKGRMLEYNADNCIYLLSLPIYVTVFTMDINEVSKDDLTFSFKNVFTNDDNRLYRELIRSIKVVKRDSDEFDKYHHKINDEKNKCMEYTAKAEKKFLLHKQLFLSMTIVLVLAMLYFILNKQSPLTNGVFLLFLLCGVSALLLRFSFIHKVASDSQLKEDLSTIDKKLQLAKNNHLIEIMWMDGHKSIFVLMLNKARANYKNAIG